MQLNDLLDQQKQVAIVLIRQGARAVIVSHETGLAAEAARRLYKHIRHTPSPSGLLPDSVDYFFNKQHRTHASAFWVCYKTASERLAHTNTAGLRARLLQGQILAVAYGHYARICGGTHKALPIDRMWHLTRLVRSGGQVTESRCRFCNAPYLVRGYESVFMCDRCQQSAR